MNLIQSDAIVNSFHAVNQETGNTLIADNAGYITPDANTVIVFPSPFDPDRKEVDLMSVVFTTGPTPLKVAINGNEMYPLYVDANSTKGVDYIRVRTIKVLSGGSFRIDALAI